MHWFNQNRLHSCIGYHTPIEIEQHHREMDPNRSRGRGNSPSTKHRAIECDFSGSSIPARCRSVLAVFSMLRRYGVDETERISWRVGMPARSRVALGAEKTRRETVNRCHLVEETANWALTRTPCASFGERHEQDQLNPLLRGRKASIF